MFKKILEYFDSNQWKYRISDEKSSSIAVLAVATDKGKFHCILDTDEATRKFAFFCIAPVNVPQKQRSQMAELLVRLNYVLFLGNFEMDFTDGEIRFKTSLIYEDCHITHAVIDHLIKGNIAAMNENFDMINSFITEKISIEEAIDIISKLGKDTTS